MERIEKGNWDSFQTGHNLHQVHKTCTVTLRKQLSPLVVLPFLEGVYPGSCKWLFCFSINLKYVIYPICPCGKVIRKSIFSSELPCPYFKGNL